MFTCSKGSSGVYRAWIGRRHTASAGFGRHGCAGYKMLLPEYPSMKAVIA